MTLKKFRKCRYCFQNFGFFREPIKNNFEQHQGITFMMKMYIWGACFLFSVNLFIKKCCLSTFL